MSIKCSNCDKSPHPTKDICDRCGQDFGDSGDDGNGAYNSRCVHCRSASYTSHCGQCGDRLIGGEEMKILPDGFTIESDGKSTVKDRL